MKKEINVVDLDRTLIPFDSVRRLTILNLYDIRILKLVAKRVLRQIDKMKFKKYVMAVLYKKKWGEKRIYEFVDYLYKNIDQNIFQNIQRNASRQTIIILLSASPDVYVSLLATKIGWIGYGSVLESGIEMYGINKLMFLNKKYPDASYVYKFSISDSISDLPLLKQFEKWELVSRA